MVRGTCDFVVRHLTLKYVTSVKFDSHRSCENEFVTLFICYLNLCDHLINRLCHFVDNRPELEPTSLPRLVAIRLAEVVT